MSISQTAEPPQATEQRKRVTIRFAGDSGDGMQLAGTQFTKTTAIFGNDLATLPDFPAEIRAPTGSLPGVSGFQISFASTEIRTPGDQPDALVAMNPAALKTNLPDLVKGGLLIVDVNEFIPTNLRKAHYESNPLEDGSLGGYNLIPVEITRLNEAAVGDLPLTAQQKFRSRNVFALGLVYWLYNRPLETTAEWIQKQFARLPDVVEANLRALRAGYNYGETSELTHERFEVPPATQAPGTYRHIDGNEATALGVVAASVLSDLPLVYATYPITPASDILHELAKHKNFGIKTIQAEDEIAAIGAAIGASYAGHLGVTGTSGPGMALKSEALNLAVMTELPLVVLDVQRAGPSTGMPTKPEQSDLLQAMFGRNGDSPVAILAPATPAECFTLAIEAFRIALKYMVPVVFLSDAYIANGSEPWQLPDIGALPKIEWSYAEATDDWHPYKRNPETLARAWAVPGQPGLTHRIGGLEKGANNGNISYDATNHHQMTLYRTGRVARIAQDIPDLEVVGPEKGDLLVLSWGGTYGAVATAVDAAQEEGRSVAHAHLRYLNPFPANLGEVISRYDRVLIPEMNMGQLALLVRAKFLVDAVSLNKVAGQPFKVSEIKAKIDELFGGPKAELALGPLVEQSEG